MIKFNLYQYTNLRRLIKGSLVAFLLILFVKLSGCLTAGTHGSINAYNFSVSKYVLQNVVDSVIAGEPNIHRTPITDSFNSKYYNDGKRYVTIEIAVPKGVNEYTFQYTGEKEYWDTAKNSEISIAYAFDKDGNGGSEGDGKTSSYNPKLRNQLISLFESEFVNKIKIVLNQKHIKAQ